MSRIALFLLLSAFSLAPALELPNIMVDKKPVDVESSFWGTKFQQEGHLLIQGSMYEVLERYPESKDAASSAKVWMYPGLGFGAVGGFLIGFEAIQPVVGGKFNAPLFFAGVGSAAVSIAFGKIAENKLVHAVETYNAAQGKVGINGYLAPTGAGLALTYKFGGNAESRMRAPHQTPW